MMKRYLSVAAALVALIGAGAVLAVAGDDPPGPPPWVRSDGTIDLSKAPDEFEVSGPNGTEVVCANGRKLKVRKELLLGPPGKTPDELRAERPVAGGRDLVWRCGRGKQPHLNPVLVPQSEDPLREGEG
jgi:hypothetical protein